MTSTGGAFKVFERLQPLTREGFQLIVNIGGETDRPNVGCQICLPRESVTPIVETSALIRPTKRSRQDRGNQ